MFLVANSEPPSERHRAEVTRLLHIPLDEAPGEWFHKMTHYWNSQGSYTTSPFVKASVRFKQNQTMIRDLLALGESARVS